MWRHTVTAAEAGGDDFELARARRGTVERTLLKNKVLGAAQDSSGGLFEGNRRHERGGMSKEGMQMERYLNLLETILGRSCEASEWICTRRGPSGRNLV